MKRTILMSFAATALFASPAAFAQQGRVHADANVNAHPTHGTSVGVDTRVRAQGSTNASERAYLRANPRSAVRAHVRTERPTVHSHARVNSQARLHASARAKARANVRSAVRTSTVPHR